jgi:hypothetical protein
MRLLYSWYGKQMTQLLHSLIVLTWCQENYIYVCVCVCVCVRVRVRTCARARVRERERERE